MATIKYLLQSKSKNAPIYIRLSLGRNKTFKRKTSLSIDPKEWSSKTGFPKQTLADNKNLSSILRKLTTFILDEVNEANINGTEVDGKWLNDKIDLHFNRSEIETLDYLVKYGECFLKNLKYKSNPKGETGVSKSTEKKYRTIVNKLIAFENYRGKQIKLTDVNLVFRNELIEYFQKEDRLSDNTIGRYLKFVKSICLDAQKNGYKVNQQLEHFQGFTIKAPKVILTLEELTKIKNTTFLNEAHEIAKDWLIIGCFTGQRVSDLLRMNSKMIEHIQDFDFIVLEQIKTKKIVQIPIHFEVEEILRKRNGEFPPVFSGNTDSNKAMFNRYLKQLCKIAEINTEVEGNKFDENNKRNVAGFYPKYELVSSHICRRSFATNHYATELYPTPILMNITGHSTEQMFLEYIGKKPIDYSVVLAKIWQKEGVKQKQAKEQKAKLEVVTNAVNQN